MYIVNATEFQNNFGKYLQIVQNGGEVVILKNGREVARLISDKSSASFLTDSMTGILKKDYAEDEIRKENRNEGMLSESEYNELVELLRLIEVGASCFNHYCVGCGVTQLNVLHNVHRRISLG